MSADTRQRLQGHPVAYLHVGLAAAMQRLHMNRSRPLLLGNVRGRWHQLAQEREPLYTDVATLTVDTDQHTPQQVADAIAAALSQGSAEERSS
jgi:shikimate kinase